MAWPLFLAVLISLLLRPAFAPASATALSALRDDFVSSSGRINSCPANPNPSGGCLLLLTHHAVLSYCPDIDEIEVLASSQNARFRGAFDADEEKCFWVLASPLKDVKLPSKGSALSTDVADELWLLDASRGADGTDAVRWKAHAAMAGDAHEVLRKDDQVFLVNTRQGSVLQARVPTEGEAELAVLAAHKRWTRRDHINQIALVGQTALVNVHNRGAPSRVALLDLDTGSSTTLLEDVGRASHGLALWHDCRDGATFLVNLDSRSAGLGMRGLGEEQSYQRVWTGPTGHFTKGLAVVGNVAYFGISAATASLASRLKATVDLVAVDLTKARDGEIATLWQRELPYPGLLNQIISPDTLQPSQLPGRSRPRRELVRNLDFSDTVNIEKTPQAPVQTSAPAPMNKDSGLDLGRFPSVKPQSKSSEVHHSGREYFSPGWRVPEGGLSSALTMKKRGVPQPGVYEKRDRPPAQDQTPHKASIFDLTGAPKSSSYGGAQFSSAERKSWSEFGIHASAFKNIATDAGTLATDDELVACAYAPGEAASDPISLQRKQKPFLTAESLNDIFRTRGPVSSAPAMTSLIDNLTTKDWWERDYAQEHNAVFIGRDAFMMKFKKNVHAIILRFSDRTGAHVWEFPWMKQFREPLQAIWDELGLDPKRVIRAQLALMPPGSTIKMHVDNGGWVTNAHRIHVPLRTNERTVFLSRCNGRMMRMPAVENVAFEINNKSPHAVFNRGKTERIHLLMDIAEVEPTHVYNLRKGEQCDYRTLPDDCGELVVA